MAIVLSRIGFAIRETGQALERFGYDLGWTYTGLERYREHLNRSQPVAPVNGSTPTLGKGAFVAPGANVVGDVTLGKNASVFYNTIVRGDAAAVVIGAGSNVQDGATIATSRSGLSQSETPVFIGANVTIGHAATLRCCTVGDEALIGMGACVLEGATVEPRAMVAAGAVVPPGCTVPTGELWGGNPARRLRSLKPEETAFLPRSAAAYVDLAKQHRQACEAASVGLG